MINFDNRFTDDDVDEMYREAPIKGSMFDYLEFTRILKHGAKDKDEQWSHKISKPSTVLKTIIT